MSNSSLPVFVFTLKKAFDTHAWSALGKLCFQPSRSGFCKMKINVLLLDSPKSFIHQLQKVRAVQ